MQIQVEELIRPWSILFLWFGAIWIYLVPSRPHLRTYLCESESNPYMKSHFWKRINAFSTLCAEKCFKVGIKFIVGKDNTGKQIDKNLFNTVLLKSFHPYCIVPIKILGTKRHRNSSNARTLRIDRLHRCWWRILVTKCFGDIFRCWWWVWSFLSPTSLGWIPGLKIGITFLRGRFF